MILETLATCPICGGADLKVLDPLSNICACDPCGYVFDNPRPALDELIAFYSRADKYDSWLLEERGRDAMWKRRLKLLLRIRKEGSLLDVGAGIGQFLHFAQPHFSSVCGTEVSRSAAEIAERKYGIRLKLGPIETIDFGPRRFDNITIFHVLEHVPNPKQLIDTVTGLLTPDGILMIAVPNDIWSLKSWVKRMLSPIRLRRFAELGEMGLPKIELDGSLSEIHLSHFTPRSLGSLLERCGYAIIANSLDPFYSATGLEKIRRAAFYGACRAWDFLFELNVYDTILTIARKRSAVAGVNFSQRPSRSLAETGMLR